ncbi:hypothetical protein B0H14DRAFT_2587596 [Mycena olivaceomarginata]|nr:hypothetical protein B0H14DRAFT_2587596 [Mycena olivaceomarginata]
MALGSGYGVGEVAGVRGVLGVGNRLEIEERVESVEESSDSSSAGLGRGKNLPVVERSGYGGCASVWFARWGRWRREIRRISVWSARTGGNGGRRRRSRGMSKGMNGVVYAVWSTVSAPNITTPPPATKCTSAMSFLNNPREASLTNWMWTSMISSMRLACDHSSYSSDFFIARPN